MRLGISYADDWAQTGEVSGSGLKLDGGLFPTDSSVYSWGDIGYVPESIVPSVGFSGEANPIATITTGIPGFADAVQENAGTSLFDIIKAGLSAWQLTAQQKAFLETNQQLIAQGRPPLAWDQFSPVASVGVSVDSGTKTMIYALGIGALAILALGMLKR
jgi:hypothetical protein